MFLIVTVEIKIGFSACVMQLPDPSETALNTTLETTHINYTSSLKLAFPGSLENSSLSRIKSATAGIKKVVQLCHSVVFSSTFTFFPALIFHKIKSLQKYYYPSSL